MKRLHAISIATVTLLLVAACGGGAGSDAGGNSPVEIDVAVAGATEPIVIPWLVGQEQGFFDSRGVKVSKIVAPKTGSIGLRTQLAGDIPIGDMSFPAVVEAKQSGTPISIVGGGTTDANAYQYYALANNDAVNTIGDIKSWAYSSPGSTSEALTSMLPEAAGVKRQQVDRVASGGLGESIALLEGGEVDATMVPPSVIYKTGGKFKRIFAASDYLKSFQVTSITTTPKYAESHPGVVKGIVAGYGEAVAWIAKNPAQAAKFYAAYVDMPVTAATEIVNQSLAANAWNVGFDTEALSTSSEIMKVAGFKDKIDYCGLFDDSFLPEGASNGLPEPCK